MSDECVCVMRVCVMSVCVRDECVCVCVICVMSACVRACVCVYACMHVYIRLCVKERNRYHDESAKDGAIASPITRGGGGSYMLPGARINPLHTPSSPYTHTHTRTHTRTHTHIIPPQGSRASSPWS